jgi:hypothetical protein
MSPSERYAMALLTAGLLVVWGGMLLLAALTMWR